MKISNLPKPDTLYYEDKDGNKLPFDLTSCKSPNEWYAQFSNYAVVVQNICFSSISSGQKDKWPIKMLKWLLEMMPKNWKKPTKSITFETSINYCFPLVKYLVENNKWNFNDACVTAANLCSRCRDICLDEIEGNSKVLYLYKNNTHCNNCIYIDKEYHNYYTTRACYLAMENKQDIVKAFKGLW